MGEVWRSVWGSVLKSPTVDSNFFFTWTLLFTFISVNFQFIYFFQTVFNFDWFEINNVSIVVEADTRLYRLIQYISSRWWGYIDFK